MSDAPILIDVEPLPDRQITLDRYSHLMPDVASSLAERLDALYTSAEQEQPSNVTELRPTASAGEAGSTS